MQRFVTSTRPPAKYYCLLIGNDSKPLLHPELFSGRNVVRKDGEIQMTRENYPKSYVIDQLDILDQTVYNWTSQSSFYSVLTPAEKAMVNSIKKFINERDQWKTLLSFHNTECRLNNMYSHGNHLHGVIKTDITQLSKTGVYRAMQSQVVKQGGTCSLKEIKKDVQGFIHYLAADPEKCFLGSNDDQMRETYRDTEAAVAQKILWELEAEDETPLPNNRKNIEFAYEINQPLPEPKPAPEPMEQVPDGLQNEKSAEKVKWLFELLKLNKECRDLTSLAAKYGLGSDIGKAICHIALSSTGDRTLKMALNQLAAEQTTTPLDEQIKNLPEEMDTYMTPRHSQALFNSWCKEQHLSPMKMCRLYQMLIAQKSHKRICIYMQGQPNSGKTALTNTLWNCMRDNTGKIITGNFPFMDCPGKKIIVGEEVAITAGNVDRFKDLLSGATVKCEIKNAGPQDCTPAIVLLNSNVQYGHNLDREKKISILCRIYNIEGLRESRILKRMTGNFHPRMFYDNISPLSQDDIIALKTNTEDAWDKDTLIGYQEEFSGDWDEIPSMANSGTSTEQVEAEWEAATKEAEKFIADVDERENTQEVTIDPQATIDPYLDPYCKETENPHRSGTVCWKCPGMYKESLEDNKENIPPTYETLQQWQDPNGYEPISDSQSTTEIVYNTPPTPTADEEMIIPCTPGQESPRKLIMSQKRGKDRKQASRRLSFKKAKDPFADITYNTKDQDINLADFDIGELWKAATEDVLLRNAPSIYSVIRIMAQMKRDQVNHPHCGQEHEIGFTPEGEAFISRPIRGAERQQINKEINALLEKGDSVEAANLTRKLAGHCEVEITFDRRDMNDTEPELCFQEHSQVDWRDFISFNIIRNPYHKQKDLYLTLENFYNETIDYFLAGLLNNDGTLPFSFDVQYDDHEWGPDGRPDYSYIQCTYDNSEWLPEDYTWLHPDGADVDIDPLDSNNVAGIWVAEHKLASYGDGTKDITFIRFFDFYGTCFLRLCTDKIKGPGGRDIRKIDILSQTDEDITRCQPFCIATKCDGRDTEIQTAFKCLTFGQQFRTLKEQTRRKYAPQEKTKDTEIWEIMHNMDYIIRNRFTTGRLNHDDKYARFTLLTAKMLNM